ncbi:septal ring lytic transglycosylase RlpA family protein [Stutzerimonas kirkiae]|uniref:Endolytic peptidoglycan transglycosylase RlpA n=1 Tax=Stutzerimonas kirkiae TaxID=2211392 RepID=A0A4Q9R0L6_9GAMM|nr:septal ring lytic transglycosylase RlpA family protein [Stutzerimonas kirkiae]TBU91993.1 septal ring lytic transglycosylase RlpA family lipoprotein [Stutzerimonas kirkiae]TBU99456.1 septal ring lytic transglycosylase RlpA family lipoprotein [Stutzerimonas kirkiae]TBV05553.1 septal ring lytic transglycosylase RlpA family lipoprotein [Stutzerimonas kirkiae]TBV10707.1 septal ring lytic transglycosylase RlpA family lipoprotein [Stutzerimonas kirkiae]
MRHLLTLAIAAAVLAGCSSSPSTPSGGVVQKPSGISGPGDFSRPDRDGAPWWEVDVSQIPDAIPMPHYGPVKASPYTVLGKTYYPIGDGRNYRANGTASWYGTKFHGQLTANGEKYDLYGMSAAHKTLPLPSYVKVTNLANGKNVVLRVNDRGPFYSDRVIDLSFAAAKKLGYAESGTAQVRVEGIDPEQWWAQRGQPVPQVLAQPQQVATTSLARSAAQPVEQYTPPASQHAAAVVPVQLERQAATHSAAGLFLQVGAFANPDAAELLKDKLSTMVSAPVFVSSVVLNEQVLHRVRLGPIASADEAARLERSVLQANLGQPRQVRAD